MTDQIKTAPAGALEALAEQQQGARLELPIETLLGMKAPYNPRRIDPAALERLRSSLRNFGAADPIIVNVQTGHIVGGHQRLEAAKEEGWTSFPVFIVDVPAAREPALNMMLNNPSAQGRFVEDEVRALLQMLEDSGEGAALAGFAALEQARLLQVTEPGMTSPDATPEGDGVRKRCEVGDLWQLGTHRLICSDSTIPDTFERLFRNEKRPLICVTDPPYGVEYDPAWRNEAAAKGQLAYSTRRTGKVENDDRADWSAVWRLCGCDVIYAWCAAGALQIDAGLALQSAGFEIRASIIWRKPNFPISRGHYTFVHEPAWYAIRNGGTAHWIGPKNAASVWDVTLNQNVPGGHSTQKPVELFRKAIGNHDGDIFEPFSGSGTCLIACEQLGRRCFAVEISPHYCDVAIARWENFTGESALLLEREKSEAETTQTID